MLRKTVIDSGPLIALFDSSDKYHKQILGFIKAFKGELFSTNAVITEVMYLLSFSTRAQLNFLQWIADGAVKIVEISNPDFLRIIDITKKYSDLPVDFADASLIVICERLNIKNVVSIDSDFYIYRTKGKTMLKNIFLKQ